MKSTTSSDTLDNIGDGSTWIIHESRLLQLQGMEGEAVVYHRETRHNAEDAVRLARPEGK